jgi:hypothetical protein
MATNDQPADDLNQANDPAQLGADQSPATTPEDDAHDMSTVMANADGSRNGAGPDTQGRGTAAEGGSRSATTQGSDFDQQRRQGASGSDDQYGTVGRGEGMGRTGDNGDEDRGYDESGYRGGVGTSGGREDLSDRTFDADQNPYTGGYGGNTPDRPASDQTNHLGLNTPSPADAESNSAKAE